MNKLIKIWHLIKCYYGKHDWKYTKGELGSNWKYTRICKKCNARHVFHKEYYWLDLTESDRREENETKRRAELIEALEYLCEVEKNGSLS